VPGNVKQIKKNEIFFTVFGEVKMTFFPTLKIGLWNLWLPSLGFYLIFGVLLWALRLRPPSTSARRSSAAPLTPLDYAMYAAGALPAATLDTLVLPRAFKFWQPE